MRTRYLLIGGGSLLVIAALLLSDPDGGWTTGAGLLSLMTGLIAVAASHMARKGLFDYFDLEDIAKKASETPQGAGLVFLGVCVVLAALLSLFGKSAHAQVPERAIHYMPVLASEIDRHWVDMPMREYLPGLIEHESCITLKHSRCWSPTSQLKTSREEGAGLGQLTRAWRADGTLRFDALSDLRDQHPALSGLAWSTIYQRPDLQMRAIVIMSKQNYLALRLVSDPMHRLAMADAAYNGGLGGVQNERRACGLQRGCDPQRWWGHVERVCLKSRQPLYAGRSACDINRHHVRDVVLVRAPKYRGMV